MSWRYYIRLPVLAFVFVWLLARNMIVLNKQAWNWTTGRIGQAHASARRNFKKDHP